MISESSLKDGPSLEEDLQDLELGENLTILHKNRKSKGGKTAGGGVAIVFNKDKIRLKEYRIRSAKTELLCAVGKLPGLNRKIFVLSAYIPPQIKARQSKEALDLINRPVSQAKNEFDDPLVIAGGDFNNRPLVDALAEFDDMKIKQTPPTRKDEVLDLVASNLSLIHI